MGHPNGHVDLIERASCCEDAKRVNDWAKPRACKAGCDTDEVLFCHADVDEPIGKSLAKVVRLARV
jgi:hypothetical protein